MLTRAILRRPGADFAAGLTTARLGTPDLALMLAQHAAYADAFQRGLHAGGILGTAKHFPGVGGAAVDTDFKPQALPAKPADLANALILAYCEGVMGLSGVGDVEKTAALMRYGEQVIQELDIRTNQVLWEWHALGHVPLRASHLAYHGGRYDFFHLNSIQQLSGRNLLISARETWGIYDIDKRNDFVPQFHYAQTANTGNGNQNYNFAVPFELRFGSGDPFMKSNNNQNQQRNRFLHRLGRSFFPKPHLLLLKSYEEV